MSIVEIRCPRCGATCTHDSQRANEYVCTHCNTTFRFVDSTQQVVTTDVRVRNCLYCGHPIEAGKGFKCTRCGKEYFCASCVDEVGGKYVCTECLKTSGDKCPYCTKYAVYRCVECGKKACKRHPVESHFTFSLETGNVRYCHNCNSFVCDDCAEFSLLGSPRCPRCHGSLSVHAPYES